MINIKDAIKFSYIFLIIFILFIFNCNTDNDCSDDYEPNESCVTARDLGSYIINKPEKSWNGTICSSGDIDWFRIFFEEETAICMPFDPQPYRMQIRLIPPQNDCIDLNLYLYDDSCNILGSSELNGCQEEIIIIDFDGICGNDDSEYVKMKVQAAHDDIESSDSYTLYFSINDR